MSQGPYDSLNLGLLTDDAPENVRENRRRLGQAVGHPWERFCYGRQVHGATVRRATEPPSAARPYTEEDGQATTLADAAAIVFVADCLPVLLAAPDGVAALHCGWRPLAAGIVGEGVNALRELGVAGPIQAAIGPGARGCCYEVGEEVHERFARYDARRMERNLDLAAVATQQLHEAGVETVHDTGCAACAGSGCSSRTAATAASPAARRESYAAPDHRPRRRADPRQPRRASARRSARRMSRSSPRSSTCRWRSSARSPRPASRWSARTAPRTSRPRRPPTRSSAGTSSASSRARKVKQILPYVELIHSVATDSALRRSRARRRRDPASRSTSPGRTARRASLRTRCRRSSSALPCRSAG